MIASMKALYAIFFHKIIFCYNIDHTTKVSLAKLMD